MYTYTWIIIFKFVACYLVVIFLRNHMGIADSLNRLRQIAQNNEWKCSIWTHGTRMTKSKNLRDHKRGAWLDVQNRCESRHVISGLKWSQHVRLDIRSRNSYLFISQRKRKRKKREERTEKKEKKRWRMHYRETN